MIQKKFALLLENVDRGTIQTVLQTNNYYRQTKLLNSSKKNWKSICDIIENENNNESEFLVLGKLTEHILFRMCLPDYEEIIEKFINLLKQSKHILFIYKGNLFGNFSHFIDIEEDNDIDKVDKEVLYNTTNSFYINNVSRWLNQNSLECTETEYIQKVRNLITRLNNELKILPYEKLIDIEIAGQMFIENTSEGLLFKVYISNEKIWSNEFNKFINLFRDYSSLISNEELTISQYRTDLGIVCSIYSPKKISSNDINELYKDFTHFMDMCAKDPKQAEDFLKDLNISDSKKTNIITKYIKESQRLLLDLQQEREIKILSIKHRLQNELNEFEISNEVNEYIENSIPLSTINSLTNPTKVIQNQNIYVNSQIIKKVDGIVSKEINGNVNFSPEELEFEKIIEKFSIDINDKMELLNSIYELKDNNSSNEIKRSSKQKLYGFLSKIGEKIGDVGVNLLTKYLENQII